MRNKKKKTTYCEPVTLTPFEENVKFLDANSLYPLKPSQYSAYDKMLLNARYNIGFGEVPIEDDLVNHPAHYTDGKIEVWDFIIDKNLPYCLGNVVKYVSRAGKKDHHHLQDLEKAAAYLAREIKRVKDN